MKRPLAWLVRLVLVVAFGAVLVGVATDTADRASEGSRERQVITMPARVIARSAVHTERRALAQVAAWMPVRFEPPARWTRASTSSAQDVAGHGPSTCSGSRAPPL
jgi:hypothetical protein